MRLLISASLLLSIACAPAASHAAAAGPTATPAWMVDPNHIFRASPGMPGRTAACRDEAEVTSLLAAFAVAVDGGDPGAIRALLSPSFWGVFINAAGRSQAAYAREDAVAYLVERSQAGDRIAFGRPQVNGLEAWDGAAHFGPVAVELRRGDTTIAAHGRGALYCSGDARGLKILSIWT